LPTVTYAGIYVVQWYDRFAVCPSVLFIVFCEIIVISWYYGVDKFCENIKEMNKIRPYLNWRLSWKYICPISLIGIVIMDTILFTKLQYGSYTYPIWSNVVGYLMNIMAVLPLFIYPLSKLISKRFNNN
jgi:hypothetical protein